MRTISLIGCFLLFSISISAQDNCDCPELFVEGDSPNYPIVLKSLCSMQLGNYIINADGVEISIIGEDNWFNTPYYYMGITPENGFSFNSNDFVLNINGSNCHYVDGTLGIKYFEEINQNESFTVFSIDGKLIGQFLKSEISILANGIYILKNERFVLKILK